MHEEPEDEFIDGEHEHLDTSGPFQIDCAFCGGTGVHPGTMKSLTHAQCPVCKGKGILKFTANRNDYHSCLQCGGRGIAPDSTGILPCPACGGYGMVKLH